MKDRDDLFDDKVKELLRKENNEVPKQINEKIDEILSSLKRKKYNYKKISGICAACIAGIILFGITMPTYAGNIPILGSIFEIYNLKQYENYDKYATELNVTKEHDGVRITINKVVYDGLSINVAYTVETNEPMINVPDITGGVMKINNKFPEWFGYNGGNFTKDNKAFIGLLEINLTSDKKLIEVLENGINNKLKENSVLSLDIRNLGQIFSDKDTKGKWKFVVPVNSNLEDGEAKEVYCDVDLTNIHKGTKVKRVVSTPINVSIQGLTTVEFMKSGVDYLLFDDKGNQLEGKGGSTSGVVDKGKSQGYFNYYFQGAYEDSESLIFIPYKNTDAGEEPSLIKRKLNLQGDTVINSNNDEEYSKITKIETKDNTTSIYYKSNNAVYGTPISIIDNKTGEKIYAVGYEQLTHLDDIKYFKDSDEFVVTFEKKLTHDDYTVEFEDYSKVLNVYNNDMFTIDIK